MSIVCILYYYIHTYISSCIGSTYNHHASLAHAPISVKVTMSEVKDYACMHYIPIQSEQSGTVHPDKEEETIGSPPKLPSQTLKVLKVGYDYALGHIAACIAYIGAYSYVDYACIHADVAMTHLRMQAEQSGNVHNGKDE